MTWTVETLDADVDGELDALPPEARARLARAAEFVEEVGFDLASEPHVRHVEGKLWEFPLIIPGQTGHVLFVTAGVRRLVIVRAFTTKTGKMPRSEIALATRRAAKIPKG